MAKTSESSQGGVKKGRIFGYDLMKCIAMYLVVLIHSAFSLGGIYENTPLSNAVAYLAVIGVPLFFAVNGALLFNKPLDVKKHYKKTLVVALIVLAWKVITPFVLALILGGSPFDDGVRVFVQYLFPGGQALPGELNPGHFWFMDALIALYLVFPPFKLAFDSADGKIVTGAVLGVVFAFSFCVPYAMQLQEVAHDLVGWTVVDVEGFSHWSVFGEYGYTLFYFLGGGLAARCLADRELKRSEVLLCLGGFAVGFLATFLLGRYQSAAIDFNFGVKGAYYSPVTVLMALGLFAVLSKVTVENRRVKSLVESIGRNTLGIYFLHMPIIFFLRGHLAPAIGTQPLGVGLLIIAGIYLLAYLIAWGCSKVPGVKHLFKL